VDTEIAEIPIEEVDASDMDLLREGALFYLSVRRRIMPSGRHENASQIVFRRLPAWQKSTLRAAAQEAAELAEFFASKDD
jgi:hypothetical protein